jgi:trehalose 6-phosphate phosphatase
MMLPDVLQPFVRDASRAALLLDFDGSIAPIVDDPATATPLPAMVDGLRVLQAELALVAVVSGRTVDFLAAALPVDGITLVGLYGLEQRRAGLTTVDARAEPWIAPIAAAADAAEAALPGLLVERKGNLCVTIHFRTAPERADDARAVADELARRYGIDAPQRGRMAVELRPPVPVDKGTVVEELTSGATVAAFAGDDAGDLPAFAALLDLVRAGKLTHGVRIGVASAEAPAEIRAADVVVDGPPALAELLDVLALAIRPRA